MKVVSDENIPGVEAALHGLAEVVSVPGREITRELVSDADALLVRSVTPVTADLVGGSQIRYVGTATAGFDHVDTQSLRQANIRFCRAAGCNADAVVDYVLSVIAACDDKLERLLAGGAVGIVGYGQVGRRLHARLVAMGISTRVRDPWLAASELPASGQASLGEVLSADVVSLHTELTHAAPWPSYHLLDRQLLTLLPAEGLLINASRGPVIAEQALCETLSDPAFTTRVALDVWETEPEVQVGLLEQVWLGTAHIAGYSLDAKRRGAEIVLSGLYDHFGLEPVAAPSQVEGVQLDGQAFAALEGAGFVRGIVQAVYDVREDDRLLRDAITAPGGSGVGQCFDALRKHYRERRELRGCRVRLPNASGEQIRLVQALGGHIIDDRDRGSRRFR